MQVSAATSSVGHTPPIGQPAAAGHPAGRATAPVAAKPAADIKLASANATVKAAKLKAAKALAAQQAAALPKLTAAAGPGQPIRATGIGDKIDTKA